MMRYIGRQQKGTFGYIRKQLIFEIIKTVILFAMALGIFFIGYLTLGRKENLWSVFAVLALLPASKSLVGVIMLARFRSLTKQEYERYSVACEGLMTLYESVLTTNERAYYIPVMCYAAGTLTAYVKCTQDEQKKLREHLVHVLEIGGHAGTVVKLYDDEDAFIERAGEIREKFSGENQTLGKGIFNTVRSVSL